MSSYSRFRAFLQEQGCEDAFDRAFYHHNDFTSLDESLWMENRAECIIGHAFDWCETPEGRSFWRDIDHKWYQQSKQLNHSKPTSAG